jgi:hypothetical protein
VLAGLIVAIAAAVGARVVNALVVAAIYFVVATAWSWFRFRQRIRAHEAAAVEQPPRGRGAGEAR